MERSNDLQKATVTGRAREPERRRMQVAPTAPTSDPNATCSHQNSAPAALGCSGSSNRLSVHPTRGNNNIRSRSTRLRHSTHRRNDWRAQALQARLRRSTSPRGAGGRLSACRDANALRASSTKYIFRPPLKDVQSANFSWLRLDRQLLANGLL